MAIRKVSLEALRPNPWQARLEPDPAHVAELAASIVAQGLLQPPAGRQAAGDKVELAYGMTRLAAYRWLAAHKQLPDGTKYDPAEYAAMHVDVRDRTDREMFEQAIAENEARKDLSPIERARAMAKYMADFGADRAAAGRLFGLQPASVSHVLALLDLTPKVAALVHRGDMPERTARMFVGLSRLRADEADRIASEIVKAGEADPDYIAGEVGEALGRAGRLLSTRYDRDGRAEGKWWRLDRATWLTEPAPALLAAALEPICRKGKVVVQAGRAAETETLKLAAAAKRLHDQLVVRGATVRELVELGGWPPEVAERAAHMVRPPACTACDQRVVMAGNQYCLLKQCFQAKRDAFRAGELADARKGRAWMPTYQRKDGKAVSTEGWYWGDRDGAAAAAMAVKQAIKEKHPDLRIRATTPNMYGSPNKLTGSRYAEVVAVGGLAAALEDAARRGQQERMRTTAGTFHQEMDPAVLARQRLVRRYNDLLADEAIRYVSGLFGGISGIVLEILGRQVMGHDMPWAPGETPDRDAEDEYIWSLMPEGYEGEGTPVLEPAERENLIRAELARRVVFWATDPDAALPMTARGYEALAAPGGPLAGLVTFPPGWADEILAAYDRGDDPDADDPPDQADLVVLDEIEDEEEPDGSGEEEA